MMYGSIGYIYQINDYNKKLAYRVYTESGWSDGSDSGDGVGGQTTYLVKDQLEVVDNMLPIQGALHTANIVAEENAYINNARNADGYWYVRGSLVNTPPSYTQIPTQTIKKDSAITINLNRYFSDADGDALSFWAVSNEGSIATVSLLGSILTILGHTIGNTVINITASDGKSSISQSFLAIITTQSLHAKSINQVKDYMVNDKKGLPVNIDTTARSLQDLKRLLDGMYAVRNSTNGVTCIGHTHRSYEAFQGSIGQSTNAKSIGDYGRAINNMTNCTCDARTAATCSCVSVNDGIVCSCNARTSYSCDCVSRTGGKYDPSCTCNNVFFGCSCEARTSQFICSCNTRCSCNAVREFS
ncbi:hypothetical protein [Lysinibacillus pakistanensis]|uniref:hypothetical protein n=1 Tax=Lysinibacillus pakistanensis TaxID=759811 RepID=UPI003D2E3706